MTLFPKLAVLALCSISAAHTLPTPLASPSTNSNVDGSTTKATLDATIDAVGGLHSLAKIQNIIYHATDIYRSHTLTQNYNLISSDQSVASAGSQNLTFDLSSQNLRSRIDRSYEYDDYWTWAFPDLHPLIDFSLVVQDGEDGYACFTEGQNSFFSADPTKALGFTDPYLTDYLIRQSRQFALPWLLLRFQRDVDALRESRVEDSAIGATWTVLEHEKLGLTMLVNATDHLPYAVRVEEDHVVYGPSTSDVVFSAWSEENVDGDSMLLPHRFQTVYNSDAVLEDFIVDRISMNADLPSDSFATIPEPKGGYYSKASSAPAENPEYPLSEVHEFFEAGLWGGPWGQTYNTSDVVVHYPIPGVKNIMSIFVAYPDYVQLLVEFEDGLLITDAAPHRSKIILEWVEQKMGGKRITHVVPSHHHRDHAGGVEDYVAAGATLVVPEVAREFYNMTGKVSKMQTYTDKEPFVLKDAMSEFSSFWKDENPHARDWSFGVAAPAKAANNSSDSFVIFNADVVNPGTPALRWDTGAARQFLLDAIALGVPRSSVLVGAHGSTMGGSSTMENLAAIAKTAGIEYPPLSVGDWYEAQT